MSIVPNHLNNARIIMRCHVQSWILAMEVEGVCGSHMTGGGLGVLPSCWNALVNMT